MPKQVPSAHEIKNYELHSLNCGYKCRVAVLLVQNAKSYRREPGSVPFCLTTAQLSALVRVRLLALRTTYK